MSYRTATLLAVVLIGGSIIVADAQAARVGGGRDVGRQNNTVQRNATPQQAPSQLRARRPRAQPQLARQRRRSSTQRAPRRCRRQSPGQA